MKKDALRVSTAIPVAPTTLYLAWLSSEQHAAMTGGAAKIDPTVGGKFTAWDGYISGKFVALDLGRRIVTSWRTTDFPKDAGDSKVEVHFEALGGSTRVTVLHTDIPEGQGEKYKQFWNDRYFVPMRTYFSKYLPDPRKPPPPRRPPPPPDDDEEEDEEETPRKPLSKAKLPPSPPSKKAILAKPSKPSKPAKPVKLAKKAAPPPKKKAAPAKPAKKKPAAKKAPAKKKPAPKPKKKATSKK